MGSVRRGCEPLSSVLAFLATAAIEGALPLGPSLIRMGRRASRVINQARLVCSVPQARAEKAVVGGGSGSPPDLLRSALEYRDSDAPAPDPSAISDNRMDSGH